MPRSSFVHRLLSVALATSVLAASAAAAQAATFVVNTTSDETTPADGLCSLREAISVVNSPPGNGECGSPDDLSNTILLPAGTYGLTRTGAPETVNATGDLNVRGPTTALTIVGAGAGQTTIDGSGGGDRVMAIGASAPAVTLQGLTITGGHAPDGAVGTTGTAGSPGTNGGPGSAGAAGGGISSANGLSLVDAAVTGNHAGNGGAGGAGGFGLTVGPGKGGGGGNGGSGGGIYATGPVTLVRSSVSSNQAGAGGAGGAAGSTGTNSIAAAGGGATGGFGGGIYATGQVTITDSTIASNSAGTGGRGGNGGTTQHNGGAGGPGGDNGADGGGIFSSGQLTITGSTISGNHAGDGGAGGDGANGNDLPSAGGAGGSGAAGAYGGGIMARGTLALTNVTLSGNAAGSGGHGGDGGDGAGSNGGAGGSGEYGGNGGAISALVPTPVLLLNVTIAGNGAGDGAVGGAGGTGTSNGATGFSGFAGVGGGVYDEDQTVTLQNSLVGTNSFGNCYRPAGTIANGGHDIAPESSCPGTVVADPRLDTLRDNGGPRQTMRLFAGSAAIDQIPASGAGCPATDERGVTRPQGAACDIGAYEVAPPFATTDDPSNLTALGATLMASVTPNSGDATVHFDFGQTTAYGSQTPDQHISGVTPQAFSADISGLSPSTTYHYRVVATTVAGSAIGDDKAFTTPAAPPATLPTGTPAGVPTATSTQSVLAIVTRETLSPSIFRAARSGPSALASATRAGARVQYRLNLAATVRFTVVAQLSGRRGRGGRCVKPTATNRRARKCTLLVAVKGSFTRVGKAGTNRFRFTGRLAKRKLKPGRYRLVATPTAAGRRGRASSAPFRIIN